MEKPKIFIDPSARILYSSYYIEGLYNVFGKSNVSFSKKYFNQLQRKNESHSYDHYMAFVIVTKNETKKYIIDFRDKRSVKKNAYDWCDKYAKINFSVTGTDKSYHDKIISIPPGFGIKIWGKYKTLYKCLSNYIKCNFSPIVSLKMHLSDYYNQYKRPVLIDYTENTKDKNNSAYVFMVGTLWSHTNCIEGTNLLRKTFVESCKAENVNFEGGFFASVNHPQYEEFKHLIFTNRYPVNEYVEKTKQSFIAFNTPAVHDCHGWKLGEYLAMGKAIISTPLSNELPEDLLHGKNIHFISNPEELKNAISSIIADKSYREKLEDESKSYYNKYASPQAVIEQLTGIKKL